MTPPDLAVCLLILVAEMGCLLLLVLLILTLLLLLLTLLLLLLSLVLIHVGNLLL